jgi:hypothetical protein
MSRRKIKPPELCDECRDEYEFGMLNRTYLRLQKLRISIEGTLRHVRPGSEIHEVLSYYHGLVYSDEKGFLERIKPMIERQPLWEWCSRVKGLGHVAASTFHSFIRTHVHEDGRRIEVNTGGKARTYFGLTPGAELRAGRRGGFNPQAKGRLLGVIVPGIIMAGDPYYRALYDAKKDYYSNVSRYASALKDPKLCPNYEPCLKKYVRKAKRAGRPPKKPTCKAHVDNLAKRWLGGILVSHATELIREGKGLDVSNFKRHRAYIRPKAFEDDVPDPDVLEQIRTGQVRGSWKQ